MTYLATAFSSLNGIDSARVRNNTITLVPAVGEPFHMKLPELALDMPPTELADLFSGAVATHLRKILIKKALDIGPYCGVDF